MISVFVQEDMASFSRTFERYWKLTSGSRMEALQHTAKNFAFILWTKLKQVSMPKGAITAERLAAMKSGEGIRISERARELVYKRYGVSQDVHSRKLLGKGGSGIPVQALLVKQELKLRESHRMFTASAARFKGALQSKVFSYSKGKQVGVATPIPGGSEKDSFEFEWGAAVSKWSGVAAVGLNKDTRRIVFNPSLNDARKDMMAYLRRKQEEIGRRVAKTVLR
jgi:hypothetical protein